VEARTELERLAPHSPGHAELAARYDLSTREVYDRTRRAWSGAIMSSAMDESTAVISPFRSGAWMLAVEIL
jgi:hypothetical protein